MKYGLHYLSETFKESVLQIEKRILSMVLKIEPPTNIEASKCRGNCKAYVVPEL